MNQTTPTGTEADFDLDLDKLEALALVAKAGHWTAVKHSWSNVGIYSAGRPVACLSIIDDATEENQEALEAEMEADAEFMVAACNAMPALIALARRAAPDSAAQPDTMANASIDTPIFRRLSYAYAEALFKGTVPETSAAWGALVEHVDGRAAQPVQVGAAADERALFEGIERASNLRRVGVEQDGSGGWYENPCTQSAWEGFQAGRASLAPVSTPTGYKLVPLEPSEAMKAAFKREWQDPAATSTSVYKAMIDAAPVSAQQGAAEQHSAVECDSALRAEPASQHDANRAAIIAALSQHRMVCMYEVEEGGSLGNTYSLIDHLSNDGAIDITSGNLEIEAIADAVLDALDEQSEAPRCRAEGGDTSDNNRSDLAAKAPAAQAEAKRLREVLIYARQALQLANDRPGGGIGDTLWMPGRPETLFDFIDTALAASPASTPEAAPELLPAELANAFITLESSGGEGRTIVLKFNQRADAYAVHDFLLKGGKEYAAPTGSKEN